MWTHDGKVRKVCQRYNLPHHVHELTFSCLHKLPLLSRDETRTWFIEALSHARRLHDFKLLAYVLMPDHAHVLLFPNRATYFIPKILQSIKEPVSRKAMNDLRRNAPERLERLAVTWPDGRIEHRFWQQGGGFDRHTVEMDAVWNMVSYIHDNPVRKGLVASATDWEWSSAAAYNGSTKVKINVDSIR